MDSPPWQQRHRQRPVLSASTTKFLLGVRGLGRLAGFCWCIGIAVWPTESASGSTGGEVSRSRAAGMIAAIMRLSSCMGSSQFVSIGEGGQARRGEARHCKVCKGPDPLTASPLAFGPIASILCTLIFQKIRSEKSLGFAGSPGLNGRIFWALRRPRDLLRSVPAARRWRWRSRRRRCLAVGVGHGTRCAGRRTPKRDGSRTITAARARNGRRPRVQTHSALEACVRRCIWARGRLLSDTPAGHALLERRMTGPGRRG
jgi:hypothetical protein